MCSEQTPAHTHRPPPPPPPGYITALQLSSHSEAELQRILFMCELSERSDEIKAFTRKQRRSEGSCSVSAVSTLKLSLSEVLPQQRRCCSLRRRQPATGGFFFSPQMKLMHFSESTRPTLWRHLVASRHLRRSQPG